MSTKTCNWI